LLIRVQPSPPKLDFFVVGIAKWLRPRVVIPVSVGSIPTIHPKEVYATLADMVIAGA